MAIQILDENTINKIAAGEVIERPSSVVKELVENAIDAGATAVTVEIKEGGISFIRITDNGCGIPKEDIRLAFYSHATSKIKSVEDLLCVSSLGFRGEALSSIAAVAQVELLTKTRESANGYRYGIEGGEEKELEEAGTPDGTTFFVRNLFFNTPVRRRFLKTPATESGYVNTLMEHLALSHPDIAFCFISNGQTRLQTAGNGNLKDIIYGVYGRNITGNLLEVNARTHDVQISGFIGKPVICRGNRAFENYYINGRYIKSPIITGAIEEAYKGYIMLHNYPFTAMHFKIAPVMLDVNVHPTKMELRFSKNEYIHDFVFASVRQALEGKNLIPEVSPEQNKKLSAQQQPQHVNEKLQKTEIRQEQPSLLRERSHVYATTPEQPSHRAAAPEQRPSPAVLSSEQKPSPAVPAPEQKPSPAVLSPEQHLLPAKTDAKTEPPVKTDAKTEPAVRTRAEEKADPMQKAAEAQPVRSETETKVAEQLSIFDESGVQKGEKPHYRVIGQLFETYWLLECGDKFYMMDQHAAHEKVLFERFMKQIRQKKMDTQLLMPPVILTLSMHEEQLLLAHKEAFTRLGYEMESFGGKEYKLTGIPAGLPTLDLKQLFLDILDHLDETITGNGMDLVIEKIASMSCKAAVKGNHKLSFQEAQALIEELMEADNPYNCPHGRPTLIVMTQYDIEKKFKRIV